MHFEQSAMCPSPKVCLVLAPEDRLDFYRGNVFPVMLEYEISPLVPDSNANQMDLERLSEACDLLLADLRDYDSGYRFRDTLPSLRQYTAIFYITDDERQIATDITGLWGAFESMRVTLQLIPVDCERDEFDFDRLRSWLRDQSLARTEHFSKLFEALRAEKHRKRESELAAKEEAEKSLERDIVREKNAIGDILRDITWHFNTDPRLRSFRPMNSISNGMLSFCHGNMLLDFEVVAEVRGDDESVIVSLKPRRWDLTGSGCPARYLDVSVAPSRSVQNLYETICIAAQDFVDLYG
jgi:hypothetical protein